MSGAAGVRPPGGGGTARRRPKSIVEQETAIGPDGTVAVEIDTALAREIHPDQDHRYQITAEVIDPSRRTIVGSGEVLVARKPFQVCAWVGRGYYRVGDVVDAHFAARTLDNRPVEGQGKVTLLRIQYDRRSAAGRDPGPQLGPRYE